MKCACGENSVHQIRGVPLCAPHAIEALEHGADLVVNYSSLRKVPKVLRTGYGDFSPISKEQLPEPTEKEIQVSREKANGVQSTVAADLS